MKKIISFLLLAALLVGCMVPAVIVSAADATVVAESVEKLEGTGTAVAPKLTIADNDGIYTLTAVVYYNKAELAKSGASQSEVLAGSIFSDADSSVGSQLNGNHKNIKAYIPDDLESTSAGFIMDLMGAFDEDAGDNVVVTADGLIANIPLNIIATEYGSYEYTVVIVAADYDGNEYEIADAKGTVTYAADPLVGLYDEFTVFTNPGDTDVTVGTTNIDLDIRFDNNPGIWSARLFIVYPEALSLSDGAAEPEAKVDNPLYIFTGANNMLCGIPDVSLAESNDANISDGMKLVLDANPTIVRDGYKFSTVYFELDGTDDVAYGNGVLCTLHFDIAANAEVGDVYDIKMYYDTQDFVWAGTDPETGSPVFEYFLPETIGANLTIVDKVCEHKTTTIDRVEPTCGADGYENVVCTDECGKVLSSTVLPATGSHTEGEPVVVDPTCGAAGTSTVYCSVCGVQLSQSEIPATGSHTAGPAPTCQAAQTCTVCGVELAPAIDHIEGDAVVTNPSCEEDGSEVYSCTMCGEVLRTEVIPATGHLYLQPQNSVVTPPTCTEDGYTTRYCDVCNEPKITDPTPAWGHDEDGDVVIVESTCTVAGTKTIYCDTCGEISKVEELPLAEHTIVEVPAYGPFCHADGVAAHWACEVCGKLFADAEATQEVDAADLVIEAENELVYVPGAEACHVPGIAEYWYCPECDCVYADEAGTQLTNRKNLEIAPDCELVHMEKVEACHANGTEEYWFCPECEAVYADEAGTMLTNRMNLTIPADAEAKHVAAVAPTCTENGMAEYWYCEECDTHFSDAECKYNVAYLSLTIPATGHNYEDGVCTVCGDKQAAEDDKDDNKAPVTGDNLVYIVVALAVVLVAGTAIVLVRRKRSTH